MALSDLKIRKAKPEPKPYKLYDSLGLFMLVKPNGSKLWRQKYVQFGKERLMTHGAYPVVWASVSDRKLKPQAAKNTQNICKVPQPQRNHVWEAQELVMQHE